jgi:hypothetical protein
MVDVSAAIEEAAAEQEEEGSPFPPTCWFIMAEALPLEAPSAPGSSLVSCSVFLLFFFRLPPFVFPFPLRFFLFFCPLLFWVTSEAATAGKFHSVESMDSTQILLLLQRGVTRDGMAGE